ncbi:hypothetical protein B296_00053899, partial [Ensete ventricosum]
DNSEQRRAKAAATMAESSTAIVASSDIGSGSGSGVIAIRELPGLTRALVRSARCLGSSECPGGDASLKHAAWRLSEMLGPRLASPESLGERLNAFCNH